MQILRPRLASVLGTLSSAVFVVVLLFRFAVYRHMYIGPNDPHGISDIIEFFLGLVLLAILVASVLAAIVLAICGPKENRIAGAKLFGGCLLIAVLLEPLHSLAAKWAP